jgi:hypothetical protein
MLAYWSGETYASKNSVLYRDQGEGRAKKDLHLLSSVDEALLCWRDTLLLLNALLYPRDLWTVSFLPCNYTTHRSRCLDPIGGGFAVHMLCQNSGRHTL